MKKSFEKSTSILRGSLVEIFFMKKDLKEQYCEG